MTTNVTYNLYYDISAVLLNSVFIILLFFRKKVKGRRAWVFMSLIIFMLLSAVMEIGTSMIRNGDWVVSNGTRTVVTALAHYFHNSIEFLVFLYVLQIFGVLRHLKGLLLIIVWIPQMLLSVFLIVPSLRRSIFYYDANGAYVHGYLYFYFYYAIIGIYAAFGIIALYLYRNRISKKQFALINLFAICMILSIYAEVEPHMRITILLQSLCLLVCYVGLENDSEVIDNETGLLSRYALWSEAALLYESRFNTYVVSIHLRNFPYYSRMLGTRLTTELLRTMGNWLAHFSGGKASVYYPSRGTYTLLLYEYEKEAALEVAERVRSRFASPWIARGTSVTFQTSVKVTGIPNQIKNEDQLFAFIENHDPARFSTGEVSFIDEVRTDQRNGQIEAAVQKALDENRLEVYFQPIHDVASGRIRSCEALVRLKDPDMGYISPEEFIRVAEHAGQIGQIGEVVFENVCRFLHDNKPERYGLEFVEVNLSTLQCMDNSLTEQIHNLMKKYEIRPGQINLEITESAVVYNASVMKQVMDNLRQLGLSFSLDDFGTGNANYSYIMNYPFDLIKVDKSFLWAANENGDNRVILDNMLQLIQGLNRKAVVEGVETEAQRDYLTRRGVDYLQGFYYSKPIPGAQFIEFLARTNGTSEMIEMKDTVAVNTVTEESDIVAVNA